MREIKFKIYNKLEKRITLGNWIKFLHTDKTLKVAPFELDGTDPDDYELMQYTGLKDKNGVEIYEGDIVKLFANTEASIIEFGEQDIGHDWQGIGFFTREKDGSQFNIFGGNHIEVIGNIYQNPELLTNNKE